MSLLSTFFSPLSTQRLAASRLVLLALILALLAGCGQKGDLYRPGKPQKLAVNFDAAFPV